MKVVIQALSSIATYSSVVSWGTQMAYEQRGYQAVGGEYLLAVMAAVGVYWLVGKWFEERR